MWGGVGGGVQQRRPAAMPAAAAPVPPPEPPSEDAIINLISMGFERDAVVQALQDSNNNVEVAANRLLSA